MTLVLVLLQPIQALGMYETVAFNEAHIAIAQYRKGRTLWFDRLPCVHEVVAFPAPQGGGFVSFKVCEVQHWPLEVPSQPPPGFPPQSAIFLQPILIN